MSLVTSCPDCGTVFKVRLEQLTARRGTVRCGNCSFTFNALDHLAEAAADEKPVASSAPDESQNLASEQTIAEDTPNAQEKVVLEDEPIQAIDFTIALGPAAPIETPPAPMQPEESEAGIQDSGPAPDAIPETNSWGAPANKEAADTLSSQPPITTDEAQPATSNKLQFVLAEATADEEPVASSNSVENQYLASEQTVAEDTPNAQEEVVLEDEPIQAIDFTIALGPAAPIETPPAPMQPEESEAGIQDSGPAPDAIPETNSWGAPANKEAAAPLSSQPPFSSHQPQSAASHKLQFRAEKNVPLEHQHLPTVTQPATSPWLLGVFGLMLLALCVGQAAFFLRTEIAARYSPAKPVLEKLCEYAGCIVGLPQHAEQLVIDYSDLQQDAEHEGVIALSSTLINRAVYAQAFPSLELTLTDIYDKPVLRRLFAPGEYLPKEVDVNAGIPAGGEIHVKLNLAPMEAGAAGYRIYILYPSTS